MVVVVVGVVAARVDRRACPGQPFENTPSTCFTRSPSSMRRLSQQQSVCIIAMLAWTRTKQRVTHVRRTPGGHSWQHAHEHQAWF